MAEIVFRWRGPRDWAATRDDTPIFWDLFRQFYATQWLADRVRRGLPVETWMIEAVEEALS